MCLCCRNEPNAPLSSGLFTAPFCHQPCPALSRLLLPFSYAFWTGFNLRQGPSPSDFPQYPPDIAELMSRNAIISCRSSSKLGELTSLTRLDLDGCSVPDDMAALSKLTNLEHLTLSVMAHDPTSEALLLWVACCC